VPPLGFFVVYAGLVGLLIGSYLNVVVHRLPHHQSTVLPRSRCPKCGAPIRARDNFPVISWLLLGGKCRDCKAPISVRYPLIELLTSALFAGSVLRFGVTPTAAFAALFCAALIALAAIDVEHFLLPDRITLPGIALGLAVQPLLSWGRFPGAIQGALFGAGLLLLMAGLWELLRGVEGMGLGDVKMLAMIGAFLGVHGVVVTLVFASLAGSIVGVTLLARGAIELQGKLPFGLFLAAGGAVALFAGEPLARAYLALL
jgi:leader peptidase (prepilin peptidase) / N-methyltransferase